LPAWQSNPNIAVGKGHLDQCDLSCSWVVAAAQLGHVYRFLHALDEVQLRFCLRPASRRGWRWTKDAFPFLSFYYVEQKFNYDRFHSGSRADIHVRAFKLGFHCNGNHHICGEGSGFTGEPLEAPLVAAE
jgi:hypothetical protein